MATPITFVSTNLEVIRLKLALQKIASLQLSHSVVLSLTAANLRCDLVICNGDWKEELAYGLLEPFVAHLKYAKDQLSKGGNSIKHSAPDPAFWFTVQRFVRFVSTPEILERFITIEREIANIDCSILTNVPSDSQSVNGLDEYSNKSAASAYKYEDNTIDAAYEDDSKVGLQRVLETRKAVLQREQAMVYTRALVTGFKTDNLADLVCFADAFGSPSLRAHGTSRSSILGEATINLADYSDASQPAAISVPLIGSDHGTILHVFVQLVTAKTGFRKFEHQRDKGLQSGNNIDKETEPNLNCKCFNREMNKCQEQISASQRPPAEKLHKDVAIDFEENHRLRGSLEAPESSITELKMELSLLQSHANEMGNETQKFLQELASEMASGQGLSKEVTFLKSEFSKLTTDLQKLTEMKSSSQFMERNIEKSDHVKKVKWVDGVLLVEDQIRNLKEKVYAGSHEPDLSFFEGSFKQQFNRRTNINNQLTCTLNSLARMPLNDVYVNIANNRFSGWIPKELLPYLLLCTHKGSDAPLSNESSRKNLGIGAILGISLGSAFFIALIALVLLLFCRKGKRNEHVTRPSIVNPPISGKKVNAEMQEQRVITTASIVDLKVPPTENSTFERGKSGSTKRVKSPITTSSFIVATLQTETNSFSQDNIIGEGSLGCVYRADFPIAKIMDVKKIDNAALSMQEEDDFYIANSSLQDLLHFVDDRRKTLTWNAHVRVALGTARALYSSFINKYLNEVCLPSVVHRNLKSANILLDEELNPYLSDSGLAALMRDTEREVVTQLVGSFGYSAPEFALSGIYTVKSDVYSFGVVILTGRKPLDRIMVLLSPVVSDLMLSCFLQWPPLLEVLDSTELPPEYLVKSASVCNMQLEDIHPYVRLRVQAIDDLRLLKWRMLSIGASVVPLTSNFLYVSVSMLDDGLILLEVARWADRSGCITVKNGFLDEVEHIVVASIVPLKGGPPPKYY
ncbi:protein STRUBBELIG-receptor family 8 [Tanacetum coccineum]